MAAALAPLVRWVYIIVFQEKPNWGNATFVLDYVHYMTHREPHFIFLRKVLL